MVQPCFNVIDLELRAYPKVNEMTPHPAVIPAHTVNRRWVTRQMAGANCRYRSMAIHARVAHAMKEMMPEASAC